MLLVVRLPSLVTESEIRVPSHLCGGDFGCASGVQKGTLLYARPGWGALTCGHLAYGVCVSFDTTDTQRGSGNDGLPASARLCF